MNQERVFQIFYELSSIPRGSYHNESISRYLADWAREHSLACDVDDALNVLIRKPGTKGYEKCEPVILQGHMDMVCQSEAGYEHDFEREGLELLEDGDFISARGTTLGADDGIAIAMALAVLESETIKHPPIEALFTTDEEVGMLGASAFDCSSLQGKRMINIDSEEEGTILVSCAGGMTERVDFTLDTCEVEGYRVTLSIENLKGGHSGTEIQNNRTNAANLMARILYQLPQKQYSLVSFTGGDKDNVITNSASAILVTENMDEFLNAYDKVEEEILFELESAEPQMEVSIEYRQTTSLTALTEESQSRILDFMNLTPFGVQIMSSEIENCVESSLNMGIANIDSGKANFGFSIRSQKQFYKKYMFDKIKHLALRLGGTVTLEGEYPAWEYKTGSKLQSIMISAYEDLYQEKPIVTGIHAGLECGIFYERIKDADIVSIGADTFDIHSPKEKLSVSSTKRVYQYLVYVLEHLNE